jgi:Zn-finger nucleic acid-binding protein
MTVVTARANPGSLIQLDQCHKCGGIWCDKWELFPIQTGEAARLESLNEHLLRSPFPVQKKNLYCPRCTAQLATPKDPLLGPDLQLRRCLKCDGIWLNRGQFTGYKRHQKKIRDEKLGSEAAVQRIPEVYQDPKYWVVTGTKGMLAYPHGPDDGKETIDTTIAGAFKIVLQSLLRLVLGL